MHEATAANLRSAFGGESMAHRRYQLWGEKALKDGKPNIARLFRAIACAEEIHAGNHFRALAREAGDHLVASMAGFGLGPTPDNLQGGIDGETYEMTEMYPAFLEVARMQGEKAAEKSFHYANEAEKIHAEMFKAAKRAPTRARISNSAPSRYAKFAAIPSKEKLRISAPSARSKRASSSRSSDVNGFLPQTELIGELKCPVPNTKNRVKTISSAA